MGQTQAIYTVENGEYNVHHLRCIFSVISDAGRILLPHCKRSNHEPKLNNVFLDGSISQLIAARLLYSDGQ